MRNMSTDIPNVDKTDLTNYPLGRTRNTTTEANGTPIIEELYGDATQTWIKFLSLARITPNGLPDNTTNGFQILRAIETLFSPIGEIKMSAGGAPINYLLCDGSVYDPDVYPDLFSVINNIYGGTVSAPLLPNFNDRVPLGSGGTISGMNGGNSTHVLNINELPAHRHLNGCLANQSTNGMFVYGATDYNTPGRANNGASIHGVSSPYSQGWSGSAAFDPTDDAGGAPVNGQSFSLMQPWTKISFYIKAKYLG